MKKFVVLIAFFLTVQGLSAQINNPVQWTFTSKKLSSRLYEIRMNALIGSKWHLYAQDAGEGPEPTTISFSPNPLVVPEGKVAEEGKLEKSLDPNFNSVLRYYSNQVSFVQKVRLKSSAATTVKGTVRYMVCNDRQCLPPRDVPFSVKIGGK
jgi:thiol:disulfide interchange protein DsbD